MLNSSSRLLNLFLPPRQIQITFQDEASASAGRDRPAKKEKPWGWTQAGSYLQGVDFALREWESCPTQDSQLCAFVV